MGMHWAMVRQLAKSSSSNSHLQLRLPETYDSVIYTGGDIHSCKVRTEDFEKGARQK